MALLPAHLLLGSLLPFLLCGANDSGDQLNSVGGAPASTGLSVLWGLADEATVVGQMFRFPIPTDAFQGRVDRYEVTEAGFPTLPGWLAWDEDAKELYGVPLGPDVDSYFIQVVAKKLLNVTHFEMAQDVFSLHVNSETSLTAQLAAHQHDSSSTEVSAEFYRLADLNCKRDEPVMAVRLCLGVPGVTRLDHLSPKVRREILQVAASELNVPTEQLRLSAEESLPADVEFVSAGPARNSALLYSHGYWRLFIAYRIGCGSKVSGRVAKLVNDAEQVAAIGFHNDPNNVVIFKWEVVTFTFSPRRRSRVVGYSTPTPAPAVQPVEPTTSGNDWRISTEAPTTRLTSRRTRPTVSRRPTTTLEPTTLVTSDQSDFEETPELPATTTRRYTEPVQSRTSSHQNLSPRKLQEIDQIVCTKGIVCSHTVDKGLFHDTEDGDAHQMRLVLSSIDDSDKVHAGGGGDWLTFNKADQQLEGLSMAMGTFEYRLAAYDQWNATASEAFVVNVVANNAADAGLSHIFKLEVTNDDQFWRNYSQPIAFAKIVAKFLKDSSPANVAILDHHADSKFVSWTNISLATGSSGCPAKTSEAVSRLNRQLSANGKNLRSQLVRLINSNNLPLSDNYGFVLKGACLPPPTVNATLKPALGGDQKVTGNETVGISILADDAGKENPFVATILPIIIIVVLLVIAALIACLLFRRNRDRKGLREAEGKNLYVSKGVPIILPDEIEANAGEPTATSPMLLKDEKPPATFLAGGKSSSNVPTSFRGDMEPADNASAAGKSGSQDRNGDAMEMSEKGRHMEPMVDKFETGQSNIATRGGSAPKEIYRPPPPFETSTASPKPRPTHQNPQQRQPPPYVPP